MAWLHIVTLLLVSSRSSEVGMEIGSIWDRWNDARLVGRVAANQDGCHSNSHCDG